MYPFIEKKNSMGDQYKKYCEQNFKIAFYSLNSLLKKPYIIEKDKIITINNLDCIRDEDYTKEFKDFVHELKSGEKLAGVFKDYLLNRDYFLKKDENGSLIDILLSLDFITDIMVYYFEC